LGAYSGFVIVQADVTHLKEVERLKTEFVSNVSHELRTPLTNLKTYLTLLRRGKPEKAPRYLDVLDHETERLAKLIHDLLDLSRLDTESTVMNLQPVSLTAVVQEMMDDLRTQATEHHHTIFFSAPSVQEDPLSTLADTEHLPEAIKRLVKNAFLYTPAGGQIRLILGQENVPDPKAKTAAKVLPMVYLQVQDNGLGLSAEDRDHLFERFFRGTAAQEMRQPGTGLGLVIAQEIVHRHHGRVEAHPNPNQGATFTIWLPRVNHS
jgi:two-component system, OmpR family, sensor histidine kinase VicK